MKIALIYPEYYDIAHFGEKRKEIPPFGVLYLTSILENKGINTIVFKVSNENYKLDLHEYDIVGFSLASSVTYSLIKRTREISFYSEDVLFIAGGIHASIFPIDVINELNIDIVCIGESENTIVEIIENYKNMQFENIKGIYYRKNGVIYNTEKRDLIENLDILPFPAREQLPVADIVMNDRLSNTKLDAVHILLSRGCPNACNFCANHDRKIRYRTGKNIRDELEYLINKYHIKGFCITDDNFIVNKNKVIDICKNIKELNLKWSSLSRVNTVDEELLNFLQESGCIEIKYGIESGSQRMLNAMNKGINLEQIYYAIKITKKVGINVKAFILHGFPGENISTTKETIELLEKLKSNITRISLFRFVPLPGSPVYLNHREFNLTLPENYDDIYIYNNTRTWWGNEDDRKELLESYKLIEHYIKENWEKF
jgi:radical SAM superfamily enzyme YgiQ (UPF0313 family)